jgi:hypothetical protein
MSEDSKVWKILASKATGISRNIYVLQRYVAQWEELNSKREVSYYHTSIVRAIYNLPSLAGGRTNSMQHLNFDGAQIKYQINQAGDVRIYFLEFDPSIKPASAEQSTGVYKVKNDNDTWNTDEGAESSMDLEHQWRKSHFAAVSGQFGNKEAAGRKLIEHIKKGFKSAARPQGQHKNGDHYSLYWQNGGQKSAGNIKHLTSLIQQAQAKNANLNWLVHGEGAGTFVQALRILSAQKDAQTLMTPKHSLANQTVLFSNPRGEGTRKIALEKTCKDAGIFLEGINSNPLDLRNEDSKAVFLGELEVKGATYAFGTGLSILGVSAAPKILEYISSPGGIAASMAIGIPAYILGKKSLKTNSGYFRNGLGAFSSTFGKGNQQWV